MYHNNTANWVKPLAAFTTAYNHRRHSVTGQTPASLMGGDEKADWAAWAKVWGRDGGKFRGPVKKRRRESPFTNSSHVRLSRLKHPFEKGSKQSFTDEIFRVTDVRRAPPTGGRSTYQLADSTGRPLEGRAYSPEMTLVGGDQPTLQQYYIVEKVLKSEKRKGGKMWHFVKFVGHTNRFNEWLPASQMKRLKPDKALPVR